MVLSLAHHIDGQSGEWITHTEHRHVRCSGGEELGKLIPLVEDSERMPLQDLIVSDRPHLRSLELPSWMIWGESVIVRFEICVVHLVAAITLRYHFVCLRGHLCCDTRGKEIWEQAHAGFSQLFAASIDHAASFWGGQAVYWVAFEVH